MILLMGIAGSGKGTQGKMLADQHGLHLISMGDVLRMYVTGKKREQMLAGALLDDQEIIDIVERVLLSLRDKEQVLLDGFPRTIPQAKWLFEQARARHFKLDKAFHLQASREAVKERLLGRGRIDDKHKAIEARFDEYERSTAPLLKWLADNGVKVVNINAERTVEQVNNDLVQHLKEL